MDELNNLVLCIEVSLAVRLLFKGFFRLAVATEESGSSLAMRDYTRGSHSHRACRTICDRDQNEIKR